MSDDPVDLADYRRHVRAWLAENLERRPPSASGSRIHGTQHMTVAYIATQRPLQRKLYEAGFAGISWPKEYGGQGLTPAHERVFDEEAEAYVLPELGAAGLTTMGVCRQTMLAHASPEFLRRHIPKMLAGEELWVQFFSEPKPARTSPACVPGPPVTVTGGSSTAPRCGAAVRPTPTTACVSPVPTGTCRSTRASPGSPCAPTPPA